MRHLAIIMIVVFGGAVSIGFAADNLPINVYPCPRAESAPVLDGRLDDAVWKRERGRRTNTLTLACRLACWIRLLNSALKDNHLQSASKTGAPVGRT